MRINQSRVQLKSIKFSEALSEETNAFVADVWFDKKKIGYAKNDGHGGETWVSPYSDCGAKLKECEAFCKSLPVIDYGDIQIDCCLDHVVDELLEEWLVAKDEKKLIRNFNKGICVGNRNNYQTIYWKGHTIKSLLEHPKGVELVAKTVKRLVKEGETILNTNLPSEMMA